MINIDVVTVIDDSAVRKAGAVQVAVEAALDESMTRFFNNIQAASTRTLEHSPGSHNPELFPALIDWEFCSWLPPYCARNTQHQVRTSQNTHSARNRSDCHRILSRPSKNNAAARTFCRYSRAGSGQAAAG